MNDQQADTLRQSVRNGLVEEGYYHEPRFQPVSDFAMEPRCSRWRSCAALDRHHRRTTSGVPAGTWSVAGLRIPVARDGWFHQQPLSIISHGLSAVLKDGRPAVFYIHPWIIESGQPRPAVPVITRIRHYRRLDMTESRQRMVLAGFRFETFAGMCGSALARLASPPVVPPQASAARY
jgi:Domain of unknown function (DUF3473)